MTECRDSADAMTGRSWQQRWSMGFARNRRKGARLLQGKQALPSKLFWVSSLVSSRRNGTGDAPVPSRRNTFWENYFEELVGETVGMMPLLGAAMRGAPRGSPTFPASPQPTKPNMLNKKAPATKSHLVVVCVAMTFQYTLIVRPCVPTPVPSAVAVFLSPANCGVEAVGAL